MRGLVLWLRAHSLVGPANRTLGLNGVHELVHLKHFLVVGLGLRLGAWCVLHMHLLLHVGVLLGLALVSVMLFKALKLIRMLLLSVTLALSLLLIRRTSSVTLVASHTCEDVLVERRALSTDHLLPVVVHVLVVVLALMELLLVWLQILTISHCK